MAVHSKPSWTLTPIFVYNFLTDILVYDNFSAGSKMKNTATAWLLSNNQLRVVQRVTSLLDNAAGVTGRTEGVTI